jgi:predicted permease
MRFVPDLAFALRSLTRASGFSILVVLTLALGIGATTAIFSIVHGVVLRPLPYPAPDRLVRITSELRGFSATDTGLSAPELFDYQGRPDLFAGVAGILPVSANVTSGGQAERVDVLLTSGSYFGVLGVAPLHGRIFTQKDEPAGVANLAVISHALWERRFGGDPTAIGRIIVIDGDPVEVIGVMPKTFEHPGRTLQAGVDIWSPAGFRGSAGSLPARGRRRLEGAIARIQPGVALDQVQAALAAYGANARAQFAGDYPADQGWEPRAVPLQDHLVGTVSSPMFVLLAGVGLLLLVACVNVAHLVLARSATRTQEMAIRQALGAGRGRLALQLAVESVLLAMAGGGLGVLIASWGIRGLIALAPGRIPRLESVRLEAISIGAAVFVALAVTVLCTLIPLLNLRGRGTSLVLKDAGRGGTSDRRGTRARSLLVAAEIAMATVLLVGAGLFVRTVWQMLQVPVGFETARLVTARVTLPRPNDPARAEYLDPLRRTAFYRELQRRLQEVPGISAAALSSQVPLAGFTPPLLFEFADGGQSGAGLRPAAHQFQVSSSYFATLGIPIARGRAFDAGDRAGAEEVAIVGETAARAFWPGSDPIGQRIRYAPAAPWITVVGVAADVLNRRLTEAPQPIIYRPLEQSSDLSMGLLLRVANTDAGIAEILAREVRAVDPAVPIHAVQTMDDVLAANMAQRRFLMRLLVVFGALATLLALLGVYGVMSYSVTRRTREIGIRLAVGARPGDVSRMVVAGGLLMTALGVGTGLAASLPLARYLESQLYGVRPADPWTMASVMLLMAIVSAAAAWLPARRAARLDPVAALRTE